MPAHEREALRCGRSSGFDDVHIETASRRDEIEPTDLNFRDPPERACEDCYRSDGAAVVVPAVVDDGRTRGDPSLAVITRAPGE